MEALRLIKKLPFVTLSLAALMAALDFAPRGLGLLALVPQEPLSSQFWRLITYPLVHLSLAHLIWDASAFLVLGAITESEGRRRYGTLLVLAALLPALALRAATHGSAGLAGSSGLDSALFSCLAAGLIFRREAKLVFRLAGALLLAAIVIKVATEMIAGEPLFAPFPGSSSPALFHACSILTGVLFSLFSKIPRLNGGRIVP
jgi:membrane associated rhomboid family serine protease